MAPVRCDESHPACPALVAQAGPVFQVVGETYHSEIGQKKKKKGMCSLQWHVLRDPQVSRGALSLARSFTVDLLLAEIPVLV